MPRRSTLLGILLLSLWAPGPLALHHTLTSATDDTHGETTVTPHLEAEIGSKQNVVWCISFQLAWSRLRTYDRLDVGRERPEGDGDVAILDERHVQRSDIDASSYVADAGLASPKFWKRVRKQLSRKFGAEVERKLRRSTTGREGLPVAFAYLLKELPFEKPLHRFQGALSLGGKRVASFGIPEDGLRPRRGESSGSEEQVLVCDYFSPDDFILELRLASPADQLLLAKVAPRATLSETVSSVLSRVTQSRPGPLKSSEILQVPVLDFELDERFDELCPPLASAEQWIKFRLDEHGVRLESLGFASGGGAERRFVFDGPFLLLLKRREAKDPYFAMWMGNAELLVPHARSR